MVALEGCNEAKSIISGRGTTNVMRDRGGACGYVARKDDPSNWHGEEPDDWQLDREPPVGLDQEVWRCPHDALDEREYCAFHADPEQLPADVDEGELFIEAINEASASDDDEVARRKKQFVGATFGPLDIERTMLDAGDGYQIRVDHAIFTGGVCADRAVVRHPLIALSTRFETSFASVSGEIGVVSFTGAEFSGDGGVSFDRAEFGGDGGVLFRGAEFRGDGWVSFRDAEFRGDGGVSFEYAEFSEEVTFGDAEFSGEVTFNDAKFRGGVTFGDAEFSGDGRVSFRGVLFSGGGGASFRDVEFSGDGDVSFNGGKFSGNGDVSFRGVQFRGDGDILFNSVQFSVSAGVRFRDAEFRGDGRVSFNSTEFSGDGRVSFRGAEVSGEVTFEYAEFSGDGYVSFRDAEVSGDGDVSFEYAEFSGDSGVSFGDVEFSGDGGVLFRDVEFSGDGGVSFNGAEFRGDGGVSFRDAEFSGDGGVSFNGAEFRGDGGVSFRDAEFSGDGEVLFSEPKLSDDLLLSFEDAEIGCICRFNNVQFTPRNEVIFTGAEVEKKLTFDRNGDELPSVFHGRFDFSDALLQNELNFRSGGQPATDRSEGDDEQPRFDLVFADAVDFSGATFEEPPDFSTTRFPADADFTDATLQNADFRNADLTGTEQISTASFDGADLSGVNFTGATLTGASFERALLSRAELLDADLTRTKLYGALLGDARINRQTRFWLRPDAPDRVPDNARLPIRTLRMAKTKLRKYSHRAGSEPYCVYDPRYRGADGKPDLERAAETYGTLETVARQNSLPGLASECFLGRKDVQLKQYWRDRNWLMVIRSTVPTVVARYGESPTRVLGTGAVTVLVCALVYSAFGLIEHGDTGEPATLFESFYFSALTFTTLGYGDFNPVTASGRMLAVVETSIGVVILAILVFVFGRRATR
jgi:uncharacterized protein YjbI with pentapeptide repeats